MTLRTNSRVAGIAFLLYIAAAMSGMMLGGSASAGDTPAAKLASLAAHAGQARLGLILEMVGCFCAFVLAVTLWAITRDEDPDVALLAAVFRVGEGVAGAVTLDAAAERIWLATKGGGLDATIRNTLAAVDFGAPQAMGIGATCFAVGSTLFAWLLLRGRIVPVPLAWIGVVGSLAAVVVLPLRQVGFIGGPLTNIVWLPLLVFEVWLALWLIVRGAAAPSRRRAGSAVA
ncbi:MAG TPA: DUF4386 domain-containing protein [Thermoanaerobaculia bacterium]